MVNSSVTVDVESVVSALSAISDNVEKDMYGALNNAAFALRNKWRLAIAEEIDKPTPFTKAGGNVLVDKATIGNGGEAVIRVGDKQGEYLSFMVEGIRREGADIGGVRGEIVVPVGQKRTAFGGIPFGPPRYIGRISSHAVKDTFIGAPSQARGRRAVYQHIRGERLKLLAIFTKVIQYKKTLPLFDIAEAFADDVLNELDKKIDNILK